MRFHPLHSIFFVFVFSLLFSLGLPFLAPVTSAQTKVEELQVKIGERNNQIQALEAEISSYNREVDRVGKEAKTLQNTLKTLDLTQKKVNTDLTLTQRKISKADLTIDELGSNIQTTGKQIDNNTEVIRDMIVQIYQEEQQTAVETFLQYKTFNELWDSLESLRQVQKQIKFKTDELSGLKVDLSDKKSKTEQEQKRLSLLKENLDDQKKLSNTINRKKQKY